MSILSTATNWLVKTGLEAAFGGGGGGGGGGMGQGSPGVGGAGGKGARGEVRIWVL